jgi:hypothetical protein
VGLLLAALLLAVTLPRTTAPTPATSPDKQRDVRASWRRFVDDTQGRKGDAVRAFQKVHGPDSGLTISFRSDDLQPSPSLKYQAAGVIKVLVVEDYGSGVRNYPDFTLKFGFDGALWKFYEGMVAENPPFGPRGREADVRSLDDAYLRVLFGQ